MLAPRALGRKLAVASVAALLVLPGAVGAAGNSSTTTSPTGGPLPFTGAVQGKLGGSNAPAQDYQFNYPGDGSQVTLNLSVDNPFPLEVGAAGFTVTLPDKTTANNTDPSPTTGTLTFSSTTAGPVLIHVFDYDSANPVNFTLTPTGLPAEAAAAAAPSAPAAAPTTASATQSAAPSAPANRSELTGTIQGKLGAGNGSTKDLTITYPGDGSQITLTLTVDDPYPLETGAAGFKVTMPDGTTASNTDPSPTTGTLTFSSTTAGTIHVQIFDFDDSHPINYTLVPQGLPARP